MQKLTGETYKMVYEKVMYKRAGGRSREFVFNFFFYFFGMNFSILIKMNFHNIKYSRINLFFFIVVWKDKAIDKLYMMCFAFG